MRITYDTQLQLIIVPDSYFAQIDKMNDIIDAAGGKKLDYLQYIRDSFDQAADCKIITQSELCAMNPRKPRRTSSRKETERR